MSFLAPLFLLGLAALAVPVVIHLTQRERKEVVRFPSLMFLQRIPYQTHRRRRLRDRGLLALRLAALLLIVAAFARPFLRGGALAATGEGAREVVVLLDRSYSLAHGDSWGRAQQAARDAVAALGPVDRASLVLFDAGAEVVVRSGADRSRILSAIDQASPGARTTRFAPALKLAGSLLAESTLPRREAILVTDFQRGGWEPDDSLRLPAGATVTPVAIAPGPAGHVALAPVSIAREPFSGQHRVVVTASLVNRGVAPVTDMPVRLEIDGRPVQTLAASIEPAASAQVTFDPVTLTAPDTRARVVVDDDTLAADNAFHFVTSPPAPLPVALVTAPGAPRDRTLYLSRALAIGDAPRFDVQVAAASAAAGSLGAARVAILNDVPVDAALAARLRAFVEAGHGLLVVAGPRTSWPAEDDTLPATLGPMVDRSRGTAAALSAPAFGHAVFEPFRAPRSGDFSTVRFYGYRQATARDAAEVLARFDDGAPALTAGRVGDGRVLLWTSTLDLDWSDLPLKPVFLPFVHQVTRYLADHRERPAWRSVGDLADLAEVAATEGVLVAKAPSGRTVAMPGSGPPVIELLEPGFYEVHEQADADTERGVVASNVELAESDFTAMPPEDLVAAVAGRPITGEGGAAAGSAAVPDGIREQSQGIWWYLLFAGILLLTAETWLAQRLSRQAG